MTKHHSDNFHAYNAATGQPLAPEFTEASVSEIDQAVRAADEAFEFLRDCPPERRGDFLDAVAETMQARHDEIVERCVAETGYLAARVEGEFVRATGQLNLFANLARRSVWDVRQFEPADPARTPFPKPEMRRRMVPVGPVAVFGACNFPLAISVVGNDFVAAIAVGCPVVVKSHPSHPGTCDLLGRVVADVIERLDFPAGTFSLLHGRRPETSIALVQHPRIAAVGFTGSPAGGRALAKAILERENPIPIFAELGSTNPVFLARSAVERRGDAIASGFANSLRFGNGHMCTKPGVVVALEEQCPGFIAAVTREISNQPRLPMLSGGVAAAFDDGVERLRNDPNLETLYRPQDPQSEGKDATTANLGPWHRGVHWFGMDASIAIEQNRLHSETFGPVSMLVRCLDEAEMLQVARQFHGSLTTTLHADAGDESFVERWLPIAERFAGRIIRNGWPTGMEIGSATQHGGPYPASLDGRSTSVGHASLERFIRPVCYQN
ncbi:aldehyde dehydrogenase (NADP(+)) [Neorhodopirellula pilleata]|uniref:NADP-dependent fatty aldehyde dehydrogenase n=1 Tax=Neorhodopirellula pilleata TaxID=2714738 RepID=A0A5C6AU34_9BACT|nr:aldehyde dehydrogenase (NADP(+)) [Neorhodopirellula pilleata]TWU03250.1 NADP-dependent fatty aldehyde dehydrogenase [Neorhodopirellula pilleata]